MNDDDERDPDDTEEIDGAGIWLEAHQVPSARSQRLATESREPVGIVWHWTATTASASKLAERIKRRPTGTERSASWHIAIDRDGSAWQSVPFVRGSWHAGGKTAARFDASGRGNGALSANALFVGVELCALGELRARDSNPGLFRAWPYTDDAPTVGDYGDVKKIGGKYYHRFTPAQRATAERLRVLLMREYGMAEDLTRLRHADIDPTRKSDPGPPELLW